MADTMVLALLPDLMLGVRVRDVLRALALVPHVVETATEAEAALAPGLGLLILDLRSDVTEAAALVAAAKAIDPELPVLAFGSHVDVERQRAALAAGCDRVVANSKFTRDLPTLIEQMVRLAPR